MGKRIFLAVAVATLAIPATAGATWNSNTWQSPSQNIVCQYRPDVPIVLCMTRNNGTTMGLMASYKYSVGGFQTKTRTLSFIPQAPTRILFYGQRWVGGGFNVTSRSDGMLVQRNGHGFFISREHNETW